MKQETKILIPTTIAWSQDKESPINRGSSGTLVVCCGDCLSSDIVDTVYQKVFEYCDHKPFDSVDGIKEVLETLAGFCLKIAEELGIELCFIEWKINPKTMYSVQF